MPYLNEHAFRLQEPDKYEDFRRVNDEFGNGIHAIYGLKTENEDTKSELQSIRFDAKVFSFDEAKKWVEEHDYSPIESEEATSEQEEETPKKEFSDTPIYKNIDGEFQKEFNDDEMTIVHYISTENIDRHGDLVKSEGMNDKNYSKNPIVLFGHNHNSFPVGKSLWRKVVMKDGVKGILAKTKFAKTEEGKIAYELWRDGFLNSASVGFVPTKWDNLKDEKGVQTDGYVFNEWELLEYSIVAVPSNAQAIRLGFEKSFNAPKIHKLYEQMYIDEMKKELDSLNEKLSLLENKYSELEKIILPFKNIEEKEIKINEVKIIELENEIQNEVPITEITANQIQFTEDMAKSLIRSVVSGVISNEN